MTTVISGDTGITFPDNSVQAVAARIVLSTAQNTTSGTAIDFTGIPSWVKRITVMFSGVSTNGASNYLVQIGSGSVATSGYTSCIGSTLFNAGFGILSASAANVISGHMILTLISGNTWISSVTVSAVTTGGTSNGGGNMTLGGTLDRLRFTSATPDTFDLGSINLLLEG